MSDLRKADLESQLKTLAAKGCGNCYAQDCAWPECSAKAKALRAALAEPEQSDPVVTIEGSWYEDGTRAGNVLNWASRNAEDDFPVGTQLYTHPPRRDPFIPHYAEEIKKEMTDLEDEVNRVLRQLDDCRNNYSPTEFFDDIMARAEGALIHQQAMLRKQDAVLKQGVLGGSV